MVKKLKQTLGIPIIIMFLIQIIGFNPVVVYAGTESFTVDMYIGWANDGAVYLDQPTNPIRDMASNIVSYVGSSASFSLIEEGAALKFNLSSVRGNITSAKLKINVSEVNGSPILNLIKITDDSWNTQWAYKPSYNEGDIINGYTNYLIASTGIQYFDVTTYVQDEQKNNNIASFALTGENNNGENDFAFICDPASPLKPALEITYAPYNVTFDSQEGNQVTAIVADYNTSIAEPSSPSKLNYTFGGWYKEATCTNQWNFTTDRIANNTTLYAKWNPVSYNVTFDSQGGTPVTVIAADYNTSIAEPSSPSKSNYTFGGWYNESTCTNQWNFTTDKIVSNTTLYAKWNPVSYNVTFDSQGGTPVTEIAADYNTSITEPSSPSKPNYTFGGWYNESTCTNQWNFTTDMIVGSTTLYAKWNPVSYNVTFDSQGGSAVSGISADYDNTISAVTPPTREGYTFDGWYKEVDCINVWNFTIDKVTSNKTLYAKWAKNKYTVNFDSQGGSQVSSQTVEDNSLITTPSVPTKTGCTFKGWYKEAEFINEWNFNEDKITCNTTLYSKWRINADINQDGEVDITDLAEIAKNYNDKSGDINWKADHDLNKDGIVDIYDLVSVSKSINQ